jgi:hypothetical protein
MLDAFVFPSRIDHADHISTRQVRPIASAGVWATCNGWSALQTETLPIQLWVNYGGRTRRRRGRFSLDSGRK